MLGEPIASGTLRDMSPTVFLGVGEDDHGPLRDGVIRPSHPGGTLPQKAIDLGAGERSIGEAADDEIGGEVRGGIQIAAIESHLEVGGGNPGPLVASRFIDRAPDPHSVARLEQAELPRRIAGDHRLLDLRSLSHSP